MRIKEFNIGRTDVLVILTGYMFGTWTFFPVIDQLKDFSIFVFEDIGVSEEASRGRSHNDAVDEIMAVLDGYEVSSMHLAGHSMGGFVAQKIAERYPNRVRSLILMGSCHITEFKNSHRTGALPLLDPLFDLDWESFFRLSTHNIFTELFLSSAQSLARLKEDFHLHLPEREHCRDQLHMLEMLYEAEICKHKLDLPCLAVYGTEDEIVPESWVRHLSKYFVISPRFQEIESSHMFMYEKPEHCASILKDWLSNYERDFR